MMIKKNKNFFLELRLGFLLAATTLLSSKTYIVIDIKKGHDVF